MSEEKKKKKGSRQPTCPYNKHILCKTWKSKTLERAVCPGCGWNPVEDERRRREIYLEIKSGKYKPKFYEKGVPR